MKITKTAAWIFSVLFFITSSFNAQVVINELNADNPSGSDNQEFIELFATPNFDLSGFVLVFYDGATNQSYGSFDLSGYQTDSLGFFVLGSALIPSAEIIFPNSFIQNGCDAVALYSGSANDFPNGTLAHQTGLMDALVYVTDDLPISALISALGLDIVNPLYQPFNETNQLSGSDISQSRIPDGGNAFDVNVFAINGVSPGWYNAPPCQAGLLTGLNNLDQYYIVKDSIADTLIWQLSMDGMLDSVLFALTDDSGNFIQWVDSTFNYDSLNLGVYHVIGLSYTGTLYDSIVGLPYTSLYASQCYDWTDNIISIEVLQHEAVLINEINADNPSGADTEEFIELITDPNASLDNLVLVLYDGGAGTSYAIYDLTGQQADSMGFFVIGSANTPNVDWIIENSTIQNGCDAVALYIGHGDDFIVGGIAHNHHLLDAMVYGTDDLPAVNLISALGLYDNNPSYAPFNETNQTNGWDKGQSRFPDGGLSFDNVNMVLQEVTPGALNIVVFGCWDSTACNYNPNANYNSGICLQPTDACDDGNPQTINDSYDANCICAGTLVGLEESLMDTEWLLFPNPANDFVALSIPYAGYSYLQWQIINVLGETIAQGTANNQTQIMWQTQTYPAGIYHLQLIAKNSVKKMTFVINH
jgi:Secretion system C-terminal sorting domain